MKPGIIILFALLALLSGCAKEDTAVIGGAGGPTSILVSDTDKDALTPAEKLEMAKKLAEEKASADTLYAAIGEPKKAEYVSSCMGEGEDGQLEYDGFTVYTYRDPKGNEAVQDVLEN